jgi:hypothetical protein
MTLSVSNYDSSNKTPDGYWDTLSIVPQVTTATGNLNPVWGRVNDSGGANSLNYAIKCDRNSSQYGRIFSSSNYAFDNSSFALAFIYKPTSNEDTRMNLIKKGSIWDVHVLNRQLRASFFDTALHYADLHSQESNFIIVNFTYDAGDITLDVYNNNKLILQNTATGVDTADPGTDNIYVMTSSSSYYKCTGIFDEFRLYNHTLSESQRREFYNSGAGTIDPLTGATPVGVYHFEENTGTTVANAVNGGADPMTLYNTPEWVDGLVLDRQPSKGCYSYIFDNNLEETLSFSATIPQGHSKVVALKPFVSWSPLETGTGNTAWALEYSITSVSDSYSDTTTIVSNNNTGGNNAKTSNISTFPDIATSSLTGLSYSIEATLYLDSTSTFNKNISFKDFGFYIFKDQNGSRTLNNK